MIQRGENVSGIYAIVHLASGRRYIGKANNIRLRWNQHRSALYRRRHHCSHLQRAWWRYGVDAFTFEILERVNDRAALAERERYWFAQYAPTQLFNRILYPGCADGFRHTPESRRLMSDRRRGVPVSAETRAKISATLTGQPGHPLSPENKATLLEGRKRAGYGDDSRAKMSASHRGRKLSPEHIAKIAARSRGRTYGPPSAETREKIRQAHIGRKHTAEAKAKIAAASRGRKPSSETIAKIAEKQRGRPKSPEALANLRARMANPEIRAKISAANKGRIHSEESRKRMSEGQQRGLQDHPERLEELRRRARTGARKRHGLPLDTD